jgi:hypothetical protein
MQAGALKARRSIAAIGSAVTGVWPRPRLSPLSKYHSRISSQARRLAALTLRRRAAWLEDRRNRHCRTHFSGRGLGVRCSPKSATRRSSDRKSLGQRSIGPVKIYRGRVCLGRAFTVKLESNFEVPRAFQCFYKVMILGWRRTPGKKVMLERATAAHPNILNVVSIKVSA